MLKSFPMKQNWFFLNCWTGEGLQTLQTTLRPAYVVVICLYPLWTSAELGEHACIRQCHSVFVTKQLHFYKYCFLGPIYDHKGAFVLGGCCVFVCGSTGLLFVEAGLDYHCRKRQLGMGLSSVGSGLACCQAHRWSKSQSLFFSLAILFRSLASSLSFFLFLRCTPPLPSPMKTFPLVNSGRKSRVGVSEEYVTLWLWNCYDWV